MLVADWRAMTSILHHVVFEDCPIGAVTVTACLEDCSVLFETCGSLEEQATKSETRHIKPNFLICLSY